MEPIAKQLSNYQSAIVSEIKHYQLPAELVDSLAEELIKTYKNPAYREWYCGVIYEFGPSRVHELCQRASEGKDPAKLFSFFVSQARKYRKLQR